MSLNTTREARVLHKSLLFQRRTFTTNTNIKKNNNNKQKSPLRYKNLFTLENLKIVFNCFKNKSPGIDGQIKAN